MKLKLGTFVLLSATAAMVSAETPSVVESIYSQTDISQVEGVKVFQDFHSWYVTGANNNVAFLPAVLQELLKNSSSLPEGVIADANGIEVSWDGIDKQITVNCDADKAGRVTLLIADYNGITRGLVNVEDTQATLSISNYVPGPYVVAVAVDGKLVKTYKIILK